MRILLLALLLASSLAADEAVAPAPKVILNAKLLRRLRRDRERQTIRWVNFENRVKSVPDSAERGFELALYFAITGDEARGKEAIAWGNAHSCERREVILIQDWVGPLSSVPCPNPSKMTAEALRDDALQAASNGEDTKSIAERARSKLIPQFAANGITSSEDLYALVELLSVLRSAGGNDIRNSNPVFFRDLPVEFLLSLKPQQVEKPDWITHVAALALVSVDPNLEASQFLQGWAMEDRQTLREGLGVAYELLWADPYLPGIAYQNREPWVYDEAGRLFARADWTPTACWISISKDGIQEANCPKGWRAQTVQFGSLKLIPAAPKCMEITHEDFKSHVVVWKFPPGQAIAYGDKKENTANADSTGMWHPGANVEGKVCRR